MEWLPHDSSALDGSLLTCDLKDMSARWSVALLVKAPWLLSGWGDDSADVAFARRHAVVRRKVINDGNSVGLIVSVVQSSLVVLVLL